MFSNCCQVLLRKKQESYRFFFGLTLEECNADAIFETVINTFAKHTIPLKKIIGFASDNASVMMGHLNGVRVKFQQIIPIFLLQDVYHTPCICVLLKFALFCLIK